MLRNTGSYRKVIRFAGNYCVHSPTDKCRSILSATLNHGDSLSLTGNRDLHNYVDVLGGRLIRPIFRDGVPSQLFDVFINPLESEEANRLLIVSPEINVDLLGCGSKLISLHIAQAMALTFKSSKV